MDCLGCNLIETSPVTLESGAVVCSSCELWRHECEVRMLVMMPTNDERRRYLIGVEEKRGAEAAKLLRQTVWRKTNG